jgi:NADPH:quinone reductase-like Zn-dependent oxidoreductase
VADRAVVRPSAGVGDVGRVVAVGEEDDVLAALPETYLTAQGSLDALGAVAGGQGRLLIRGGTSSVGMAAASIASGYGVKIAATTRQKGKTGALTAAGVYRPDVDRVFGLDDIVAAHRYMENNQATGKLVVVP